MTAADEKRTFVAEALAAGAAECGSVLDLLLDSVVRVIPGFRVRAGKGRGRQAFLDAPAASLIGRLAKLPVPKVSRICAEGDDVVVHWRRDTPLKRGRSHHNNPAWFLTMQDGMLAAIAASLDLTACVAALGGEA